MQPTPEMIEREAAFKAAHESMSEGLGPVILTEIFHERVRQQVKWGEQNHPNFPPELAPENRCRDFEIPTASDARLLCENAAEDGSLTYADILLEEFSEAFEAPDEDALRAELIQVAAVAHAWVDCIDRKRRAQKKAEAEAAEAERRAALTQEERDAEDAPVEAPPAPEPPEETAPYKAITVGRIEQTFTCDRPVSMDEEAWLEMAENELRVHLAQHGVVDVERVEIVAVKPATVTVYGHSDDLVEIEGDLDKEFNLNSGNECALIFDDGTVVKLTYTGAWIIDVLAQGPGLTFEKVENDGVDSDNYTDRVTLNFPRGIGKVEYVESEADCGDCSGCEEGEPCES